MVSRHLSSAILLAIVATATLASAEEGVREQPFIRHDAPEQLVEEATTYIQVYVEKRLDTKGIDLWVEGQGAQRMRRTDEPGWYRGALTPKDGSLSLDYAIELERSDGARVSLFASRRAPYRVLVEPNDETDVSAELEADVDGRHDVVFGGFTWGDWGDAGTTVLEPSDIGFEVPRRVELSDHFWSSQLGYRHRFHGTVHHLGVRVAGMRGEVPIEGQLGADPVRRGYNLVQGDLAIRWWRYGLFIVEPAIGFYGDGAVGGGYASLRFGRIYGSGLQVGGGWLEGVGGRFFSRVELGGAGTVVPWLRGGSTFALTDAPDPGRWGLQATADLRIDPGAGLSLRARGGYQTRMNGTGGPIVGGGVDYAF